MSRSSCLFEAVLLFKDYESNYNSNRYDSNDQKQNCQSMLLASFPRRNEDRLSLFWRFEITSRMRQGLLGPRSSLLMSDGFSHRLIIICTVFREWCIFQIYRVTRGHAHIFRPVCISSSVRYRFLVTYSGSESLMGSCEIWGRWNRAGCAVDSSLCVGINLLSCL